MPAFSFSDEQLLFLLLGLFYALECVSILGKPAFCFRPAWRSDHRTEPSSFLASGDRGVVFHGVLPFQQSFQCQYFPWDLDEHGILLPVEEEPLLNGNPTTVSLRLVLFTELAELTVSGSHLFCGEEIRLSCSSPRFAQAAFRRFCQIRDAAPADRGHVIQQQITAAFDVASLEQKYRRFRKLTRPLQLASSAWALWTLGSIALRNFWPQGVRSDVAFMVALMGFVLFWILTAWTLLRANRVLQVSRGREWSHHLCQLLLTPSAAMRSPDWMSRHLFEDEDPLTVAAVLGTAETFRILARQRLLALQFPLPDEIPQSPDLRALRIWTRSRKLMITAVQALITLQGGSLSELQEPPRQDPDAESYCPRCRGQYVRGARTCPACPGLTLQPFDGVAVVNSETHSEFLDGPHNMEGCSPL